MSDWSNALTDLQTACQDTFGILVSYIPSMQKRPELGGTAIEITGIFDNNRETVNLMAGAGSSMEAVIPRPVVELRLVDLGIDPMDGDEVIVNNVSYRIMDVQPEGNGTVVLFLSQKRNLLG